MNTRYIDLIDQSFHFPQDEFQLEYETLRFHGINLMTLVEQYCAPFKFTYLPQISNNIQRAKGLQPIGKYMSRFNGLYTLLCNVFYFSSKNNSSTKDICALIT